MWEGYKSNTPGIFLSFTRSKQFHFWLLLMTVFCQIFPRWWLLVNEEYSNSTFTAKSAWTMNGKKLFQFHTGQTLCQSCLSLSYLAVEHRWHSHNYCLVTLLQYVVTDRVTFVAENLYENPLLVFWLSSAILSVRTCESSTKPRNSNLLTSGPRRPVLWGAPSPSMKPLWRPWNSRRS